MGSTMSLWVTTTAHYRYYGMLMIVLQVDFMYVTIRTRLTFLFSHDSLPYTCQNPMTHSDSGRVTHYLRIIPYDIITDVTMTHTDSCLLITDVIMTHS